MTSEANESKPASQSMLPNGGAPSVKSGAAPPPLIFMHILKTAGSSILSLIESEYPPERIAYHYPADNIKRPEGAIDIGVGHVVFGYHKELGYDEGRYFTFVRDPMKRMLSQINFALAHYPRNLPDIHTRGLRHAVVTRNFWFYDNTLVRTFAGIKDTIPFGKLDESAVEQSLENARRHFFFIGEQENFEADLRALVTFMGWRMPLTTPSRNIGVYEDYDYNDDDRLCLGEITQYDTMLWKALKREKLIANSPAPRESAMVALLRASAGRAKQAARSLKRKMRSSLHRR